MTALEQVAQSPESLYEPTEGDTFPDKVKPPVTQLDEQVKNPENDKTAHNSPQVTALKEPVTPSPENVCNLQRMKLTNESFRSISHTNPSRGEDSS